MQTRSFFTLFVGLGIYAVALLSTIAPAQAPPFSGPVFVIVPIKPLSLDKHYDTNCGNYFVRSSLGGGVEVLTFHYVDQNGATKQSSSSISDLSYNIDEKKSTPVAQFISGEGDNIVWQLNLNQRTYTVDSGCLKGIRQAGS